MAEISIILTSYNVRGYIARALESALSQQDVDLEVICVDDSSTDGTYEYLQGIEDPRVATLRLNANGGPSVARNAGITRARGQWLAVLDGDDAYLPGRLARCLAAARAQKADIILDNLTVLREADNTRFPMFPAKRLAALNPLSLADYIEGNRLFAPGYTLGYTKPVFSAAFLREKKLAYDPAIRIGEDYHLMAECLAEGARCIVLPEEGYQYTVRTGSISHRLTLADITRMQETDAKLLARHTLSGSALAAQKRREASFRTAAAFTRLIDALKMKNAAAALREVLSCPACLLLLRMPLQARLRRLQAKCCGGTA